MIIDLNEMTVITEASKEEKMQKKELKAKEKESKKAFKDMIKESEKKINGILRTEGVTTANVHYIDKEFDNGKMIFKITPTGMVSYTNTAYIGQQAIKDAVIALKNHLNDIKKIINNYSVVEVKNVSISYYKKFTTIEIKVEK